MSELFDILTFDSVKAQSILDVGDTYEEIAVLTTPDREIGTYMYMLSLSYNFDSVTTSAYMRFSIDGGVAWTEFSREPSDKLDTVALVYAFPKEVATVGPLSLHLEMRKGSNAGTLNVEFLDLIIERKK